MRLSKQTQWRQCHINQMNKAAILSASSLNAAEICTMLSILCNVLYFAGGCQFSTKPILQEILQAQNHRIPRLYIFISAKVKVVNTGGYNVFAFSVCLCVHISNSARMTSLLLWVSLFAMSFTFTPDQPCCHGNEI